MSAPVTVAHPPAGLLPLDPLGIRWDDVEVVFTDVDETLVDDKSMRSFLAVAAPTALRVSFQEAWDEVDAAGRVGGRDAANAAYYALFAGCGVEALAAAARTWSRRVRRDDYWLDPAWSICREARRRRIPVVLVSGSLRLCLQPIAERVGSLDLLCTELEVGVGGVLTGRRTATAIGAAKAARAHAWAAAHATDLGHALALGDHESDTPLLSACGQAVSVGTSEGLRAALGRTHTCHSTSPGWSTWSAPSLDPTHIPFIPGGTS